MAPVPRKNVTQHFSHPHPLIYHSDHQAYVCHACKTSGSGDRFRCHACVLDIHLYCADCPRQLSSFLHNHPLALMVRKPQPGSHTHNHDRICDVCRESISFGAQLYRCNDCQFYVHPLCTQLPKELRHVIDNKHTLKLQKLSSGSCVVCRTDCSTLWVYGCDICRVNIHLDCTLEPYDSPATQWSETPVPPPTQERSSSTSRGIPFAPSPWATRPPPYASANYARDDWYSGGPFPYGFDHFGKPNPFGNFGLGGHTYGYATAYGVPSYHYVYPSGFPHGYANNYVNHQASQSGYYAAPQSPPSSASGGGKLGKSMFSLVGRLTIGVLTSFIFGTPICF